MDRKQTAWKKSRTFGDVFGGRTHRKIPDRILRRAHSLNPPGPHDSLPIFIVDNPSREYFFPLSADEIQRELRHLPKRDWSQITHIWERRFKKTEYEAGELPLAEFICGSGVRLVVLYPWPKDLRMPLGEKKPGKNRTRIFTDYTTDLHHCSDGWYLKWTMHAVKNFCVEQLLYHEIGHHVDWYRRHWSQANRKAVEEFADQYAFERTSKRTLCYRGMCAE
jgi:hypothetical protein